MFSANGKVTKEIRLEVWRETGCPENILISVTEEEYKEFWNKIKSQIEREKL